MFWRKLVQIIALFCCNLTRNIKFVWIFKSSGSYKQLSVCLQNLTNSTNLFLGSLGDNRSCLRELSPTTHSPLSHPRHRATWHKRFVCCENLSLCYRKFKQAAEPSHVTAQSTKTLHGLTLFYTKQYRRSRYWSLNNTNPAD